MFFHYCSSGSLGLCSYNMCWKLKTLNRLIPNTNTSTRSRTIAWLCNTADIFGSVDKAQTSTVSNVLTSHQSITAWNRVVKVKKSFNMESRSIWNLVYCSDETLSSWRYSFKRCRKGCSLTLVHFLCFFLNC